MSLADVLAECPDCEVQWEGRGDPCWMCGRPGEPSRHVWVIGRYHAATFTPDAADSAEEVAA